MKIIRYMLLQWNTDTLTGVETGPYIAGEGNTHAGMKSRRTSLLKNIKRREDYDQRYGRQPYQTYRFEIHKLEADTTLIP